MNENERLNEGLFNFITKSPSCFHAVENVISELSSCGYGGLTESSRWNIVPGGKYYVTRNRSSMIAFSIPADGYSGFMIAAAHSDSPTFKIKDTPELSGPENYIRLNTERYGGMIYDSWFDRPLSAAGRIMLRCANGVTSKLVYVDRDIILIPHTAVHMLNPNNGITYNPASDLVPLCGLSAPGRNGALLEAVAEAAGVDRADILSHDLYLVNRQRPTVWGINSEFISSPKLDDLQCVYCAMTALVSAGEGKSAPVLYIADNEEVGSATKQGAASTFLYDTLTRINFALGRSGEDYHRAVASSMMLSADNAHAVHPNHPELADSIHRPKLNGGVVIKYNASQLYTTDAVSAAVFGEICRAAGVPSQVFCNRSDIRGGSTLGNISNSQVSMNAVDVGIAELAMHSSYETAGALDTAHMTAAMRRFFETSVSVSGTDIEIS